MELRYLNYDNLNVDEEYFKIKKAKEAEIMLYPDNRMCLFILGMLFANGVKIKILNEKDLNLEITGKSFSMMAYVWSKMCDDNFPLPDYSDVTKDIDRKIVEAKNNGIKFGKTVDNPIENKIFLICPVRRANDEQRKWIEDFVEEQYKNGYIVHAPHLHTNQVDQLGGYSICKQNAEAIASSGEVNMYYDQLSTGSAFDLGVAYALDKPLILLNADDIVYRPDDRIDNIVSLWTLEIWPNLFRKKERFNGWDLRNREFYMDEKGMIKERKRW